MKEKKNKQESNESNIKNLSVFQRMNFLHQASYLMASRPETENLSRLYSFHFKKIMQRNVLRT